MVSPVRIELFGGIRVAIGDRQIERFPTRPTAAILGYLALNAGRWVPREALAEVIWPEGEPTAIRNRLNTAVSTLRRTLQPPGQGLFHVIHADHSTVGLHREAITVDVDEFRAALRSAESARTRTDRISALQRAVEVYQGEVMAGFYDDWLMAERLHLADAYAAASDDLVRSLSRIGHPEGAVAVVQRRIQAEPTDVQLHATLMELLIRIGRPRAALTHFEGLSAAMVGGEASAELGRLARRAQLEMQREPIAKLPRARTKGLIEFSPAVPRVRELPAPLFSLIGRQAEIELAERLVAVRGRLHIRGLPGMGKSRLALELAHRAQSRGETVAWDSRSDRVDLAVVPFSEGVTAPAKAKRVIWVGGTQRMEGTSEITLGPLPVPDRCSDLLQAREQPAVQLFVGAARLVRSDFALTERTLPGVLALIERVDGHPRALVLAATCVRSMSPAQIAAELPATLFTATTRGHTLFATGPPGIAIRQALDALAPADADVLALLGALAGSWSTEWASAFLGQDRAPVLEELVAAGWVVPGPEHLWRVPEFVRSHLTPPTEEWAVRAGSATCRGTPSDADATLRRALVRELLEQDHAAKAAEVLVASPEVAGEAHDLVSQVRERLDRGDVAARLTLLTAVRDWRVNEYDAALTGFRRAVREADSPDLRAEARLGVAGELHRRGKFAVARRHLTWARRHTQQPAVAARLELALGNNAMEFGRFDEAQWHYEAALAISRENGLAHQEVSALANLANWAVETDQTAAARQWIETARTLGDGRAEAWTRALANIVEAKILLAESRPREALAQVTEALELMPGSDAVRWRAVLHAARAKAQLGETATAVQLLGYMDRYMAEWEGGPHPLELEPAVMLVDDLERTLGASLFRPYWNLGRNLTVAQVQDLLAINTISGANSA